MALKISLDDLTKKQKKSVIKNLLLTPKKYNPSTNKYTEEPPFMFCTGEDTLSLPLFFAKNKLEITKSLDKPVFEYIEPFVKLRDYQIPIFKKCVNHLQEHGTVTLKSYPGSGKTIMCASLWAMTCGIGCVLTHLSIVPPQWKASFLRAYPSLEGKIWIVGEEECPKDVRIILCMIGRIHKIPEEIRNGVNCLILDESHLLCTRGKVEALLHFEVEYLIVASATLERTDEMEKMMHLLAGEHSVLLVNESPYLVFKFNTNIIFELKKNLRGVTDFNDLLDQQSSSSERNEMAVNIISNNLHRKYIVLCRRKKHAEIFSQMCREKGIDVDTMYGTKKKYQDSTVLVGTIPKIGTAFDEENGCATYSGRKSDTLILLSTIKCNFVKKQFKIGNFAGISTLEQIRGRIMRSYNPCIIYFVDDDRISQNHFRGGQKLFENTNGRVIEVDDINLKLPEVGSLEYDEE